MRLAFSLALSNHFWIKSKVMTVKEMVSNWKSWWLFSKFSLSVPLEMCKGVREQIEFSLWKVTIFFFIIAFQNVFLFISKKARRWLCRGRDQETSGWGLYKLTWKMWFIFCKLCLVKKTQTMKKYVNPPLKKYLWVT